MRKNVQSLVIVGFLAVSMVGGLLVAPVSHAAPITSVSASQRAAELRARAIFASVKYSAKQYGTYNSQVNSRQALLARYNLTTFDRYIYTDDFGPLPADFYKPNKTKTYIHTWHEDGYTFVDIAYWSAAQKRWVGWELSDRGISKVTWGMTPPYVM